MWFKRKKLLNTHPLSAAITAAPIVGIFGLFYSGICECCSLQAFGTICETSHGRTQIAHRSHWVITRVFWIINRVFQVICLMFSMFSQLPSGMAGWHNLFNFVSYWFNFYPNTRPWMQKQSIFCPLSIVQASQWRSFSRIIQNSCSRTAPLSMSQGHQALNSNFSQVLHLFIQYTVKLWRSCMHWPS